MNGGGHTWFGRNCNQDIDSTEATFSNRIVLGKFTSVEEASQPEALVQWTVDGLRMLANCHVRAVDLQGRIVELVE